MPPLLLPVSLLLLLLLLLRLLLLLLDLHQLLLHLLQLLALLLYHHVDEGRGRVQRPGRLGGRLGRCTRSLSRLPLPFHHVHLEEWW